jgi:predicted Zn-dependent protease
VERGALSLAEITERAERLVRVSPADSTIVTWLEGRRASALESTRSRRAEEAPFRTVVVRVREGRRTGLARAEAGTRGELEATLRQALAVARAATISSDWVWPSEGEAKSPAPSATALHDPEIGGLAPATMQARLSEFADKRTTLRAAWSESRVAVAASGRPTRAAAATELALEARTGRRPGSGFVAGASRRLAGLSWTELLERARSLEAGEVSEELPPVGAPAVLSPETAAVLVESLARELFSGRRFLAGEGPLADPTERRHLPDWFHLADEPLDPAAIPFPFDLDGVLTHRRELVKEGELAGPALDLELASRCGRVSTAQGLASDDAFPCHPQLGAGEHDERELLARAAGGVRIGSVEGFRCFTGPGLPFTATARSVRRIGEGGALGAALPPLTWRGRLLDLWTRVEGLGRERAVWEPQALVTGFGATVAPAVLLSDPGELVASPNRF